GACVAAKFNVVAVDVSGRAGVPEADVSGKVGVAAKFGVASDDGSG
nr:hypothetical protein [Tanacetum cinerariifolium]